MRLSPRIAVAGVAIMVLMAVGLFVWKTQQAGDPTQALARGEAALAAGQPRTARVELMNAIKADPDLVPARIAQARVYLALDDGASAQAEVERARALKAPIGMTRALMAHALLLQGDSAKALAEAEAPDVTPNDRAYAARIAGRAHANAGDTAAAARSFGAALARAPKDGAVWADVARFRLANGDQAGAIAASAQAVALTPTSADALTLRGVLVRDQFGMAASLPWFDRATTIDPGFVPGLAEYAATLADMGQARRAVAMSRRVLALAPANPRALLVQALVAARAGNDDLARALVAKIEGDAGGWPATMLLRGALHLRAGNAGLAVEQFDRLARIQPDNMTVRLLLARALHAADGDDRAASVITPALAGSTYATDLAARVQERLGDRAAADALLERAAWPGVGAAALPARFDTVFETDNADPRSATAAIPAIRRLLGGGDVAGALTRATALRDANPGAPAASLVLGDVLMAANRPLDAAKAYEAAANLRFDENAALRLIAAWRAAGRPDKAAAALSLYHRQNPSNIAASRIAAAAWADVGNWTRAAAILESLRARLGDNDALLMADLAWAWGGKGDAARALAYARNAYRLQPASPFTSDVYGWALMQAGDKGPASVDLLEKAVALAPQSPLIRMHLGQAYAAAGRRGEALAALRMAASTPAFTRRDEARAAIAAL